MDITDEQKEELIKNTHGKVNCDADIFDNIDCMNCGYDGLVNTGADTCPQCNMSGVLSWKENQPNEIIL